MEFLIDDTGILRRPTYHDGYLLAVETPQKKTVHLKIEDVSGNRFILEMTGVERFLCDGFAEGNIISTILISRGRLPDEEALRRLLGEPGPMVKESYVSRHEAWVEGEKQAIAAGDKTFIELMPSYGAEVFAVCEDFHFHAVLKA